MTLAMDREEFLKKIFCLYPKTFTGDNSNEWLEAYKQVLPTNADFEALYNRLIFEYSGANAPKPAWFADKIVYRTPRTDFENLGKPWKDTIWGTKNGIEYEFGVEICLSVQEAENILAKRGFYNIRRKEENITTF